MDQLFHFDTLDGMAVSRKISCRTTIRWTRLGWLAGPAEARSRGGGGHRPAIGQAPRPT